MSNSKKNKRQAVIGTILFHIGLLCCFIFLGLTYQIPPPPEEGITINFGFDDAGQGIEQSEQISEETQIEKSQEVIENTAVIEETSIQNVEETPVAIENKKEEKEIREVETVKEKEEQKVDIKALYPGKKNNNSSSQGETVQPGDQGSEKGDPNSTTFSGGGIGTNGVSYQLGGRTIAEIIKPKNDTQQQGKVVVTIRVNRNGKVINATAGAKGSTTTNTYLLSMAKNAALKTSFEPNSSAPEIQIGTIVYNFTLN